MVTFLLMTLKVWRLSDLDLWTSSNPDENGIHEDEDFWRWRLIEDGCWIWVIPSPHFGSQFKSTNQNRFQVKVFWTYSWVVFCHTFKNRWFYEISDFLKIIKRDWKMQKKKSDSVTSKKKSQFSGLSAANPRIVNNNIWVFNFWVKFSGILNIWVSILGRWNCFWDRVFCRFTFWKCIFWTITFRIKERSFSGTYLGSHYFGNNTSTIYDSCNMSHVTLKTSNSILSGLNPFQNYQLYILMFVLFLLLIRHVTHIWF